MLKYNFRMFQIYSQLNTLKLPAQKSINKDKKSKR